MNTLILFVTFAVIFGLIDAMWLKSSSALYKKHLGHLMRDTPNFVAAVVFYIIYVFGVVYFALQPGVAANDSMEVLVPAAVLAFVAYATYDLTNYATIKGWAGRIVIIDIIWGTVATTVSAGLTFLFVTKVLGL